MISILLDISNSIKNDKRATINSMHEKIDQLHAEGRYREIEILRNEIERLQNSTKIKITK